MRFLYGSGAGISLRSYGSIGRAAEPVITSAQAVVAPRATGLFSRRRTGVEFICGAHMSMAMPPTAPIRRTGIRQEPSGTLINAPER